MDFTVSDVIYVPCMEDKHVFRKGHVTLLFLIIKNMNLFSAFRPSHNKCKVCRLSVFWSQSNKGCSERDDCNQIMSIISHISITFYLMMVL